MGAIAAARIVTVSLELAAGVTGVASVPARAGEGNGPGFVAFAVSEQEATRRTW